MSDQRHCSLESVNVRAESACRGCGGPKDEGLLVCWHCFKGRPGCYKHAQPPEADQHENVHLDTWLRGIGRPGLDNGGAA